MSIDTVLSSEIGPIGKWQLLTLFLVMIPAEIPISMIPQLANLSPKFICSAPWFANWTYYEVFNFSSSLTRLRFGSNDSALSDLSCQRFDLSSVTSFLNSNVSMIEKVAVAAAVSNLSLESCPGPWLFDSATAPYRWSLIEGFELVCDRKALIPNSMIWYAIGIGVGQVFGGQLSDRFGRLRVTMISFILTTICLVTIGFCKNIWAFFAMRTITAIVFNFGYVASVTMYVEISDDQHRNTLNLLSGLIFTLIGGPLMVLISFIVQDWRYVHLTFGVIMLSFTVACFLLLQESPRWLIAKGRYEEALKVVRRAIRINTGDKRRADKVSVDDLKPVLIIPGTSNRKTCTLILKDWMTFFRTPGILRRLLPMMWMWVTVGMNFYCVSFYAVRLDGNPYVISIFMMIIAAPASLLMYFLAAKLGRKVPLFIMILVSTIFMLGGLIGILIPNSPQMFVIVVTTLVMGCISASFTFVYMYTPELFATMQRSKAIGFCSFFGRFGMIAGSFVERLDELVWRPLPLLFCSVVLLVAVVASLFLPPDAERMLRDTAEADVDADADVGGDTEMQEPLDEKEAD